MGKFIKELVSGIVLALVLALIVLGISACVQETVRIFLPLVLR